MPAYLEGTTRRSPGLLIAVVIGAVVVLCGLGGVGGFLLAHGNDAENGSTPRADGQAPASPTSAAPAPRTHSPVPGRSGHTVVYELSGESQSAIVTYVTNGAPSPTRVDLPWRTEVTVDEDSYLAMVFALDFEGDPLTCRILVDGREATKKTGDNAVTCTHLVVN